eukprot:scaffold102433_cov42-Phaeocystis_antarctica.AAC.1
MQPKQKRWPHAGSCVHCWIAQKQTWRVVSTTGEEVGKWVAPTGIGAAQGCRLQAAGCRLGWSAAEADRAAFLVTRGRPLLVGFLSALLPRCRPPVFDAI